jgi:hypothetical protein
VDENNSIQCSCTRSSTSDEISRSEGNCSVFIDGSIDGEKFWKPIFSSVVENHQGAHVIPVGGKNLLRSIRSSLPDVPNSSFSLLLGDYFLDERSSEWQPSIFSALLRSKDYDKSSKYYLQNLQIPMISPVDDALAIPLTKDILSAMLSCLFSNDEGTLVTEAYSPEVHSSFTVLVFSQINSHNDCSSSSKRRRVHIKSSCNSSMTFIPSAPPVLKFFGPNDLVVFIDMLQAIKINFGGMYELYYDFYICPFITYNKIFIVS